MSDDADHLTPGARPWTVTADRTVLQDRWIHVTAEDCVTAEGVRIAPFYLYNFPDFCHAAAVTAQGRLVMVRQYRHGARRPSLELPGGLIDAGETPQAAVARELLEETGYAGRVGPVIAHGFGNPANVRNRTRTLLITQTRRVAQAQPEPSEALDVVEVAWSDIPALILKGEIINPMHIAALMQMHLAAGGGVAPLPAAWTAP